MSWKIKTLIIAIVFIAADRSAAQPLGGAGLNPSSPMTGYIDPTSATFNGNRPMNAETVASGVLSTAKHVTFVTIANTQSYTYGDPVVDGFVKCIKIKSVSGTPSGTLTPTHLADSTIHTIT
jgi:hypothetical protein